MPGGIEEDDDHCPCNGAPFMPKSGRELPRADLTLWLSVVPVGARAMAG